MMPIQKSTLVALVVLVAMVSLAQCSDRQNEATRLRMLRRGIVLKCQGNPVSCYGKRSSPMGGTEQPELESTSDDVTESSNEATADSLGELKQELNMERHFENLIHSCRANNMKSCSTILRVMMMNSMRK